MTTRLDKVRLFSDRHALVTSKHIMYGSVTVNLVYLQSVRVCRGLLYHHGLYRLTLPRPPRSRHPCALLCILGPSLGDSSVLTSHYRRCIPKSSFWSRAATCLTTSSSLNGRASGREYSRTSDTQLLYALVSLCRRPCGRQASRQRLPAGHQSRLLDWIIETLRERS